MPETPYPRFRRDLVVRRVVESGDASWTVHDPLRNGWHRHGPVLHQVCVMLDGTRGPAELKAALESYYPQYSFSLEQLEETVDGLRRGGFLEDTFRMNEIQLARAAAARRRFSAASLMNPLKIQFGVMDPTALFRAVYPVARILFTRPFIIGAVIAFLIACGLLWDR